MNSSASFCVQNVRSGQESCSSIGSSAGQKGRLQQLGEMQKDGRRGERCIYICYELARAEVESLPCNIFNPDWASFCGKPLQTSPFLSLTAVFLLALCRRAITPPAIRTEQRHVPHSAACSRTQRLAPASGCLRGCSRAETPRKKAVLRSLLHLSIPLVPPGGQWARGTVFNLGLFLRSSRRCGELGVTAAQRRDSTAAPSPGGVKSSSVPVQKRHLSRGTAISKEISPSAPPSEAAAN